MIPTCPNCNTELRDGNFCIYCGKVKTDSDLLQTSKDFHEYDPEKRQKNPRKTVMDKAKSNRKGTKFARPTSSKEKGVSSAGKEKLSYKSFIKARDDSLRSRLIVGFGHFVILLMSTLTISLLVVTVVGYLVF